jgi:hypothetical protein
MAYVCLRVSNILEIKWILKLFLSITQKSEVYSCEILNYRGWRTVYVLCTLSSTATTTWLIVGESWYLKGKYYVTKPGV